LQENEEVADVKELDDDVFEIEELYELDELDLIIEEENMKEESKLLLARKYLLYSLPIVVLILLLYSVISNFEFNVVFILLVSLLLLVFTAILILTSISRRIKANYETFVNTISKTLTEINFPNEDSQRTCSICKLEIKPHHTALKCPNCNHIFHKEHLLLWFKSTCLCPICKYDFKASQKNLSNYSEI